LKIMHVGVGNLGPGGVATYVRMITKGQIARGHSIDLVELWPGAPGAAPMPEVETVLRSMDEFELLQKKIQPDLIHLHGQLPQYDSLLEPSVMTAHEHTSHCPSGGRYLEARRKICDRDPGFCNCLWGHFVDRCGSRSPSSILKRLSVTRRSPSFPGHWIAPSNFTRDWLLRTRLPLDHVHLVGNPFPAPSSRPISAPSDSQDILFLGRLVANKGCDVLLRALSHLAPPSRVVIVGDGPERSALENLVKALDLTDRVIFTGWMKPEIVSDQIDRCRVLAVPSLWPEPFGLVVLEAYAAGRPVVASRSGGLSDLVLPGTTGELVEPGNSVDLADALRPYLADPERTRSHGEEGRQFAQNRFALEGHLDQLDKIYELARKDKP
jgi:glycosyltransferase involved in cell wall biosynthesis